MDLTHKVPLINRNPQTSLANHWISTFRPSAEDLGDERIASEFTGYLAKHGVFSEESGSGTDSRVALRTAHAMLNLSEIVGSEGVRPELDPQGELIGVFLGRVVSQIVEVMGADFVKENIS